MIQEILMSPRFREMFRTNKTAFTRNRILDFPKVVLALLSGLSKSLSAEVYAMIRTFRLVHYSKQALSWARLFLKYTAFIFLNAELVRRFYRDGDFRTYRGRIFLAVDGFTLGLPNVGELKKKFGFQKNQNGDARAPSASCIALYDILNEIVISSDIRKYLTSERTMALKAVDRMLSLIPGRKYLLTADRGFPGMGMFFFLSSRNIDFVIRNQSGFLKEFSDIYNGKSCDLTAEVKVQRNEVGREYHADFDAAGGKMTLRMVKVEIGEGKWEFLVTNLLDREEFPPSELKEIYSMRWCIETDIKRKKVLCELENFASKTRLRIKQEFYAKMFIINMSNMMINDIEEELQEERKDPELKINRNIAYGIFRQCIFESFLDPAKFAKEIESAAAYLKKQHTKVKPKRTFPRKPFSRRRRPFHITQRRSC